MKKTFVIILSVFMLISCGNSDKKSNKKEVVQEENITVEEVLKYPLPSAEDYNGYYQNPVSLQHPLSTVEIVPCDSSWTLIISRDKVIIDGYLKRYPKCEELSTFNQR